MTRAGRLLSLATLIGCSHWLHCIIIIPQQWESLCDAYVCDVLHACGHLSMKSHPNTPGFIDPSTITIILLNMRYYYNGIGRDVWYMHAVRMLCR
jgi:hypothetical protein